MKLLFISSKDVHKTVDGGFLCTNRNYSSFCTLLGVNNVNLIDLSTDRKNIFWKVSKRLNYFYGFNEGLTKNKLKWIVEEARKNDFVFIDNSLYGAIALYLKRGKYEGKIISFFHNVEHTVSLQRAKLNPIIFWQRFITYYNEKLAFRCSDKRIALNQRDVEELRKIYGRQDVNIIPVSLIDKAEKMTANVKTSIPPTCVFLGSLWYANVQGLQWFITNVLDHVNIKLQVVGRGMDSLSRKFAHPKIEFIGYVENLSSIISAADYIVSPIFQGSGMKVKTCEALMHGKNIIGTKEAFEGYEVDYKKIGALCNNGDEFIIALNDLTGIKRARFNKYSRAYFLKEYSYQATLKKFKQILS